MNFRELIEKELNEINSVGLNIYMYDNSTSLSLDNIKNYLRKSHKIEVEVKKLNGIYFSQVVSWAPKLQDWITRGATNSNKTYENALEKGILVALEILKLRLKEESKKEVAKVD